MFSLDLLDDLVGLLDGVFREYASIVVDLGASQRSAA
jgi:hypothetical protein